MNNGSSRLVNPVVINKTKSKPKKKERFNSFSAIFAHFWAINPENLFKY